jgi:phosphoribosyl-AMP cyclohydrolase
VSDSPTKLSHQELEEGAQLQLDFTRFGSKNGTGVLPVVVQDIDTGTVLLLGHASREALEKSLETRLATFWSMSRNELWVKGLTSGSTLELVEVRVNCEQNSLLYLVRLQHGGACHTKDPSGAYRRGCYYRKLGSDGRLVLDGK